MAWTVRIFWTVSDQKILNSKKASFHYSILESFREMMIDCTHDFVHLLKSSEESTHDFLGKGGNTMNNDSLSALHKPFQPLYLRFTDTNLFFRLVQQSELENHLQDCNGC